MILLLVCGCMHMYTSAFAIMVYSVDLTYVHVLIIPKREVKRVVDLTADETSDLWLMAQKVGKQLESYHKASSLTFTIQVRPISSRFLFACLLLVSCVRCFYEM